MKNKECLDVNLVIDKEFVTFIKDIPFRPAFIYVSAESRNEMNALKYIIQRDDLRVGLP